MTTTPTNGKTQDSRPGSSKKNDLYLPASISSNDTQVNLATPVPVIQLIQIAQYGLAEIAQHSDSPPLGLVEAADALDEAEWYLARGLV